MTARLGFALSAVLLLAATASAQTVIVNEDFEGYGTNAALNAVWVPNGPTPPNPGANNGVLWSTDMLTNPGATPEGDNGGGGADVDTLTGDAVDHIGGNWMRLNGDASGLGPSFAAVKPTASLNVVLEGDLYDRGNSGNKRMSIGLRRHDSVETLFEMGMWNTVGGNYFAFRMVTFGATLPSPDGTSGWQRFTNLVADDGVTPITNAPKPAAWHAYKAVFEAGQVTMTLDLNRDGNINSTMVIPATTAYPSGGFTALQIGGPSGVASTGGGIVFDNVILSTESVIVPPTDDADFDGDGDKDGADFLTWQRGNGINDNSATLADGDATGEGNVDGADLAVWETQFGTSVVASQAIPEPASLALGALALVGLAAARRRR